MRVTTVEGARTRELRRAVLRAHLPASAPLPGDDLADAVHLAASADDGRVLGTCFVSPEPCDWRPETPAWRLRSMAVDPARRAGGIGAAVLAAAVSVARRNDAAILWCHARETAAGFYLRHGWANRRSDDDPGLVYDEPETGIPHRDMWIPLG